MPLRLAIGFDREVLTDSDNYLTDVGAGFETSFRLKDYTIFIGGVVAHTLDIGGGVEARFDGLEPVCITL